MAKEKITRDELLVLAKDRLEAEESFESYKLHNDYMKHGNPEESAEYMVGSLTLEFKAGRAKDVFLRTLGRYWRQEGLTE